MENVFIKGISIITPWGVNEEAFSAPSEQMELEIDFSPSDYGWNKLNRAPKPIRLGCVGIGEALQRAGYTQPIAFEGKEAERTGLIVASSFTNLEAICSLSEEAKKYGVQYVNPSIFPNTVLNIIAGQASIYFNIQGANITVSHGQASGWKALLYAHDLLVSDQLDRVIVCELRLRKPSEFEHISEVCEPESVNTIVLERERGSGAALSFEMKPVLKQEAEKRRNPGEMLGREEQDEMGLGQLIHKVNDFQKLNRLIEESFSIVENNERFFITMKKEAEHL